MPLKDKMINISIYNVKVIMKNEKENKFDKSVIFVKAYNIQEVYSYINTRIDIKETIEISKDFGIIYCNDIKDLKDLTSKKLEIAYKEGYIDGQQSSRRRENQ